jgi:hypothetical protein
MDIKSFFNKKWKVGLWIFIFTDIFITYFMGTIGGWPSNILETLFGGAFFTACFYAFIIAKGMVGRIKYGPRRDDYIVERRYENPLQRMPDIPPMNRERDWRITEQRQRRRYFS